MAGEPREGPIGDQLYICVHDDPVISKIESRGPISWLEDFSPCPSREEKGSEERRRCRQTSGDARKRERKREIWNIGRREEKVRPMKSIGPRCGFESLVPTI